MGLLLPAEDFDRTAALHCQRWQPHTIGALRDHLVAGQTLSEAARSHEKHPQSLVSARFRFLRLYNQKQAVKVDVNRFMQKVTPKGAGALVPFRSEIQRLTLTGYTVDQIADYLKANDIRVKPPVLKQFLKGLTKGNAR